MMHCFWTVFNVFVRCMIVKYALEDLLYKIYVLLKECREAQSIETMS